MTTKLQSQINFARDIFREGLPPKVSENIESGATEIQNKNIQNHALKVGDMAPDFVLENQHGESVSLARIAQGGYGIVTFYRGSWCPYCNLHLLNYQQRYDEVKALGADLIALTAELPEGETLAQTLELPPVEGLEIARPKIQFSIAHDANNKVSHQFGVVIQTPDAHLDVLDAIGVDLKEYNGSDSGEVADPATYIVDSKLNIVWAFVPSDYRVRADISEVIDAIKSFKSIAAA